MLFSHVPVWAKFHSEELAIKTPLRSSWGQSFRPEKKEKSLFFATEWNPRCSERAACGRVLCLEPVFATTFRETITENMCGHGLDVWVMQYPQVYCVLMQLVHIYSDCQPAQDAIVIHCVRALYIYLQSKDKGITQKPLSWRAHTTYKLCNICQSELYLRPGPGPLTSACILAITCPTLASLLSLQLGRQSKRQPVIQTACPSHMQTVSCRGTEPPCWLYSSVHFWYTKKRGETLNFWSFINTWQNG